MKKKLISCILSVSMLYTSIGILPVKAEKMPAEKTNETYNVMIEKSTYTFGSTFNQVKAFNTSSLSETKIADTGLSISTSGSNYSNVVIMDSSTKTGTGYYPLGTGLSDNGYYLFMGTGGNSNTSMTLKFDNPIESEKYIKITYAKPTSTNNGSTNRSAGNENTMSIDGEKIDTIKLWIWQVVHNNSKII